MTICEKCKKQTVVIYITEDGKVCGDCKDLLNNKGEKGDTTNGRSDTKL